MTRRPWTRPLVWHAAFFGVGAYTSTLLYLKWQVSPWLGMWLGAVLAIALALVIGGLSMRLRGAFFVMVTLAFGAVLHIVAVNWRGLTAGSSGLSLPFHPAAGAFVFGDKLTYAYVALAMLVLYYAIARLIERSRLGFSLVAFRENDDAARALGIRTLRARLMALGLSAGLTGVCGTFYAQYVLYIDPDSVFGLAFSFQVALLAIVGGLGTASGPVVGSLLITPLGHFLVASLGGARSGLYLVIYGSALIVVLLTMPDGIMPALQRRLGLVRS